MDPATANFPAAAHLPTLEELLAHSGIGFSKVGAGECQLLRGVRGLFRGLGSDLAHPLGYEIRAYGHSESAREICRDLAGENHHGGHADLGRACRDDGHQQRAGRGGTAGAERTEGAGFIGIAVALMGRSHPLGVLLAAILFGFLYQGGAELALWTKIPRELIVVIQALVILFTGALDLNGSDAA